MSRPVRPPRGARRIPAADELPLEYQRDLVAWLTRECFRWYLPTWTPIWVTDQHLYAHRYPIEVHGPRGHGRRLPRYMLTRDGMDIRTKLIGHPIRTQPPIAPR